MMAPAVQELLLKTCAQPQTLSPQTCWLQPAWLVHEECSSLQVQPEPEAAIAAIVTPAITSITAKLTASGNFTPGTARNISSKLQANDVDAALLESGVQPEDLQSIGLSFGHAHETVQAFALPKHSPPGELLFACMTAVRGVAVPLRLQCECAHWQMRLICAGCVAAMLLCKPAALRMLTHARCAHTCTADSLCTTASAPSDAAKGLKRKRDAKSALAVTMNRSLQALKWIGNASPKKNMKWQDVCTETAPHFQVRLQ